MIPASVRAHTCASVSIYECARMHVCELDSIMIPPVSTPAHSLYAEGGTRVYDAFIDIWRAH